MLGRILKFLYISVFSFFVLLFAFSKISGRVSFLARTYITGPVRSFYAFFTNFVPFAIFEVMAVALVVLVIFLLFRIIKGKGGVRALSFILSFFILGYIISLGIDSTKEAEGKRELSHSDYILAGEHIARKIIELSARLDTEKAEDINSDFLTTLNATNDKIIPKFKNSYISVYLTRLGTLSYYSPFTMEIILNDRQPSFMKRYSLAHELAHYLGYIREDEASYYAFKLLCSSDDAYNLYAAYLFAFVSVGAVIYQLSPDDYMIFYDKMPPRVKKDLKIRADFLSGESKGGLGDTLNDNALLLVDSRGSSSYNSVASFIAEFIISSH